MPSKPRKFLVHSPKVSVFLAVSCERKSVKKSFIHTPTPLIATLPPKMKKSGLLAAYVAAASATAVSVSSPSPSSSLQTLLQDATVQRNQENSSSASSSSAEKFAPRFDGLRFIETLVTAHR